MRRRSIALASWIVLATLAAGLAAATEPIILSAEARGRTLLIRGADLVGSSGEAPFVTLSGEPLEVRPGFDAFEVRAALPALPPGSYLLTVAHDAEARVAGILAVTLAPRERGRFRAAAAAEGMVSLCANRRHVRLVDGPEDCRRNETVIAMSGSVVDDPPEDETSPADPDDEADSDADSDEDSDADSDEDSDADSDEDSDADSDEDSDSDSGSRGQGNGNNGNGNGNGNSGNGNGGNGNGGG